MTKSIKDISHKAIDTLSDGVFSIALTLLGIDVVALVPKLTHSGDVLGSLIEHLPTFLAFFLGFVVLFSWWYSYHVSGQYVVGTNVQIVWIHGFTMLWVALMPFAVAMLAETLNTDERQWGILFFTICLFGQYWTTILVSIPGMITRGTLDVTWTDDFPLDQKALKKYLVVMNSVFAFIGIITAIISMIYPWVALGICGLVILNSINPVGSMARMIRQSVKTK
jgi:uncharacterized membrane protein